MVTLPPNMGVAFSETNTSTQVLENSCTVLYCTILYCTQVLENSAQEAVLKVLPLTNKPVRNIRLGCEVAGAVDMAGARADQLFRGQVTSSK